MKDRQLFLLSLAVGKLLDGKFQGSQCKVLILFDINCGTLID